MSDLPPPQFPPPQPASDITRIIEDMAATSAPTPWWRRPFLKLPVWSWILAVVALVSVGVAVAAGGGKDEPSVAPVTTVVPVGSDTSDSSVADETLPTTEPTITQPEESVPVTEPPATTPTADVVDGAPTGERGTQSAPVAPGVVADIGAGWRLQVLDVVADGAAAVAAENEFNDPPPDGSTFSLVTVALGYFGLEDPVSAFTPTINALGSGKVQLDTACGVIPDELSQFVDLFAGSVVVGNLCFVTTPADAGQLLLYATADFFEGDDVFVSAAAPAAGAAPMAALTGPQPGATSTADRTSPVPLNTVTDVGQGWSVTVVGPARDITDAVATDNFLNDPPPTGSRFIGIDVTFTRTGSGSDVALTARPKAVAGTNVELPDYCGVVTGEADMFSDVFEGGSVTGTVCFVVPEGAADQLILYSSSYTDVPLRFFATR